jgi:hypothetical protein
MPIVTESAQHKELKRLALAWAQAQGYRVAAAEVSLPNFRFRLDAAGYRPQRVRVAVPDARRGKTRAGWREAVGLTAVFECKVSVPDFRRDAASLAGLEAKLKTLHARKAAIENELRLFYPSIRNGDALFQDYESLDYTRPGHERYQQTLEQIARLDARRYANTKFDKLVQWGAANLFYLVAEAGTVAAHEVPPCWGLLIREGATLTLAAKPLLHEIGEQERLWLLHRIALAATRAVNREHGVEITDPRLPRA